MKRLIVGITGASGACYGIRALELLREQPVEVHLVVSRAAERVLLQETHQTLPQIAAWADVVHEVEDVGASIASGSFPTAGMLIAPCSMRTLSRIATGDSSSLMTRAADVVLKERRRLVLMVRETPLHLGHLRAMCAVTEMGGIVMPPIPSFYSHPTSIDELITTSVARALDLFGFELDIPRWGSTK